jgi:hypothetical protein
MAHVQIEGMGSLELAKDVFGAMHLYPQNESLKNAFVALLVTREYYLVRI